MFCQEKLFDIIRQIATDAIIPVKSAIKAANNTNLVFLIFTELVYMAIVYIVVSVEPIIVATINPIKESTPNFFIKSVATAIDPLPEIGLKIASGIISGGIFNIFSVGFIIFITKSKIPELLRAPIAKKSPIKVGNILITIFIPSFAPFKKISNTFFLSKIPYSKIIKIDIGTTITEK